jgi:hypothetical protein
LQSAQLAKLVAIVSGLLSAVGFPPGMTDIEIILEHRHPLHHRTAIWIYLLMRLRAGSVSTRMSQYAGRSNRLGEA